MIEFLSDQQLGLLSRLWASKTYNPDDADMARNVEVASLVAEVQAHRSTIATIRARHYKTVHMTAEQSAVGREWADCKWDGDDWPCMTIRHLGLED